MGMWGRLRRVSLGWGHKIGQSEVWGFWGRREGSEFIEASKKFVPLSEL